MVNESERALLLARVPSNLKVWASRLPLTTLRDYVTTTHPGVPDADIEALDQAFGTTRAKPFVERKGNVLTFRPMTSDQARAYAAAKAARGAR